MRQKLNVKGNAQPTGRGADRGWSLVVGCSAAVFRQVIRSDNGASLPHIIWTTDGVATRWMLCEAQFAAPWSRHWRCWECLVEIDGAWCWEPGSALGHTAGNGDKTQKLK
jgi:hypothetical protein